MNIFKVLAIELQLQIHSKSKTRKHITEAQCCRTQKRSTSLECRLFKDYETKGALSYAS